MYFKILCTIILTLALGVGSSFAAEDAVTVGVYSSHKNLLEVQWVCYDGDCQEFAMIEDLLRMNERLKNEGGPDFMIRGLYIGSGNYRLFLETPFGIFPYGTNTWEVITNSIPEWKILGDLYPTMFVTANGFEDVWTYFEFTPVGIEGVKTIIRRLNAEDLKQYEGI